MSGLGYYAVRFLDTELLPASSPKDYPKVIKSGIRDEGQVRNSPAITGPCGIATLLHRIGRPQLLERLLDVDGTATFSFRVHTGREWLNDIYVTRQRRNVEIGFIVGKSWAQDAVRYIIKHEDSSPYRSGKWKAHSLSNYGTAWKSDPTSVAVQSAAIAKAIWFWGYDTYPQIDVTWSGITSSEKEDLAAWLQDRKARLVEEAKNKEATSENGEPEDDTWIKIRKDLLACRADCGEEKPTLQCSSCGVTRYCSRACQMDDWKYHKTYCGFEVPPPQYA